MILIRKWGSVVLALVIAYLVISGNRGLWNLYKLHEEKNEFNRQIALLKTDIGKYQMEYKILEKNASTMEKQAREELNLVKPGEIVYKFSGFDNHH